MRFRGLSASTRGHFTRQGAAKKQFDSREAAEAWAAPRHKNPYRCGLCKKWHVGGVRP